MSMQDFRASIGRVFVAAIVGTVPLAPLGAQAGVGEIAGKVQDSTGAAISDASVFVPALRRGTISDGGGLYRVGGVAAGTHSVVAQRVGFAPETLTVVVGAAVPAEANFMLRSAAVAIAPVVVSATRDLARRSEGSVTTDAISGAELREARAVHPAGIMNRVPGVHVSELSGEGHSMAIRQPITTKAMYLYLEDGIPTRATGFFNHNALYEVNIPQAGGVEVIKGPGTALYGSDALGGIVNVLTRPAPVAPTLDATLETGAYGYLRALVSGGASRGAHGVRADVNVTHSDNWKQDAPFDRLSGTLRWDASGGAWTAKTILTGSRIDQQDVPAISRGLFDTAITVNTAPIAYRRVRALRLSTALERDLAHGSLSLTPYVRVNQMDLLPSWQLTFDPQTWVTKNNSAGLVAKFSRDLPALRARAIVGVDGDVSPGSFLAKGISGTRTGPYNAWTSYTETDTHYDYDVTYRAVSPYVHADFTPLPRLRLDLGVRADFAGYDYESRLEPLATGAHRRPADTSVSYTHVSPKVGASFEVAPSLDVFASFRHGFRAPTQGQLFQQNSAANTVGLDPVTLDSWETGARGQVGSRFVYQLSLYDMNIRDDIITFVTSANTREALNAGRTRHRGVELSTGVAVLSVLRLDAAYSWTEQKYVEWIPQAATGTTPEVDFSGNVMEQAPRDLSNVLLTWSPRLLRSGRVAAEWTHTGRYAQDAANTEFYNGYDLVHLHFNVFIRPSIELFGRVTNVTDRRFAELVSYDRFVRDQYTPGAPRSFYVGARYAW